MRRILLIALTLTLSAHSLQAQRSEILSIEECRNLALQYNKKAAAAREQSLYAEYTRKSYLANYFPNIKATGIGLNSNYSGALNIPGFMLPVGSVSPETGSFTPNGTYSAFPGMDMDYKVGTVWGGAITLEQPLFYGGKITAAYRMARSGAEMAKTNERLTESEVIVETEEAYALLVKAQEMKKVAESYHDVLVQLEKNVASAVNVGMKQRNDLLKVQVYLSDSELSLMKAENATKLAQMNLCHMIGYSLGTDIQVASEYPQVVKTSLNRSDITSRPEYEILEKQVEMARQEVNLQKSELLPQLGMSASYGYVNGLKVSGKKVLDDATYAVMLKLSIPIFHFGERINKVKAAKAQLRQKEYEVEELQEKMLLELTMEANKLDEAFMESEIAQKALESAQENRNVSQRQYEAGMETLVNLLEAQTLWQSAYEKSVEAHFQLYNQYVSYLKASGQLVSKAASK